jgi:DNA-binding winged helix-turn-helix (wHTH) protein
MPELYMLELPPVCAHACSQMSNIVFGPFCLDLQSELALRDGEDLRLRYQAFCVLRVLLQRAGEYVGYEKLLHEAWDGTVVSRHTVASTIADVRRALGEYGSWISYRPKWGYRLDVPRSDELIRTGWHFWNRRTREGFEKAIDSFQRASVADSSDPRAFEGLARGWMALAFFGMTPPRPAYEKFLEAHSHAVAFRGLTPDLRLDRGHGLHVFERQLPEAEVELLQSHADEPTVVGCVRLVLLYTAHKRFETAARYMEQGLALDRLYVTLPATATFFWLCQRRFKEAAECGKQGLDLHPFQPLGRSYYAQALELSGCIDDALEQYRIAETMSPDIFWLSALKARCLALHGRRQDAEAILADLVRLRSKEYVDAYYMALLQEALGNRDAAFEEFARAEQENSATLYMLEVDPRLDSLRGDTRLDCLTKRLW